MSRTAGVACRGIGGPIVDIGATVKIQAQVAFTANTGNADRIAVTAASNRTNRARGGAGGGKGEIIGRDIADAFAKGNGVIDGCSIGIG